MAAIVAAGAASCVALPVQAQNPGYHFFKSGPNRQTPGAYWDPCGVVKYGIDLEYARKAGLNTSWELQRWKSAVAAYADAMGIRFRYMGQVRTRAQAHEPRGGPELVITFGHSGTGGKYGYGRVLKGPIAGVAGITWQQRGSSRAQITRGYVVIDAKDLGSKVEDKAPDPRPASEREQDIVRTLYMHEFGHAVGLDHVKDRSQLMYPQLVQGRPDDFGPGDLAGLRALGRASCF